MGCRGVLFALSDCDERRLRKLAQTSAEGLVEFVQEEIEERWEEEWLQETDKAWDAIHRALGDGSLAWEATTPRQLCVIGGEPLHGDDDSYIVSYKTPAQVAEVASAIAAVTENELRAGYDAIPIAEYAVPLCDEDFEYTWYWFEKVKAFYAKAAAAKRAVIFTADQ